MKKNLIVLITIFSVIVAAGLVIHYILSLHKVSFDLGPDVSGITVYKSSQSEAKRLSTDGELTLREGAYYIIPEGERIAKDKIEFSVKGNDISLEINPAYTKDYLKTLLDKEQRAIQAALEAKYPSLIDDYTLSQGTLYMRGEWFGGLLKPKVADIRDQRSPYRVILHKKENVWTVVRRPEYILTSSRYSEVPVDILRDVNSLVGELGN